MVKAFFFFPLILWIGGLLAGLNYISSKAAHFHFVRQENVTSPPLSRLEPNLLKIFTLGHKALYDDFAQLWMVQIFVNPERMRADPQGTKNAVRLVARHDPKIEGFYMLGCFSMIKDLADPKECEPLMQKAIRLFPASFRSPMIMGYVSLFELNQPAKAAAYYAMASTRPDAPPYPARLAKRLLKQADGLSAGDLNGILEELSKDAENGPWQDILKSKYQEIQQGSQNP